MSRNVSFFPVLVLCPIFLANSALANKNGPIIEVLEIFETCVEKHGEKECIKGSIYETLQYVNSCLDKNTEEVCAQKMIQFMKKKTAQYRFEDLRSNLANTYMACKIFFG